MIDIKNKKCKCGRQPCFNFHYSTKPICCSKCKEVGMIDIKNKKKILIIKEKNIIIKKITKIILKMNVIHYLRKIKINL